MKMRKIVINRQLVPMKAHYFLWNAGTGPVIPFLSTYARQLGFSSVIVGLIYTILPVSGLLAKPLFGAIADKFHCRKKIFLFAQLLTAAMFLAIFYSPQVLVDRHVQFSCYDNVAVFNTNPENSLDQCTLQQIQQQKTVDKCTMDCAMNDDLWNQVCNIWNLPQYCNPSSRTPTFKFTASVPKSKTDLFNKTVIFRIDNVTVADGTIMYPQCPTNNSMQMSCNIECDDYNINDIIAKPAISDSDVHGLYQFWIFLMFMILAWVGQALAVSIGDAICFELLGDKPNRYGYQRLFGSLGWGVISAITGVMIDALSKGRSQKDYTSAFYMGSAFLVLDFFVSSRIQHTQKKMSSSIFRDVGSLLTDIRVDIYLLWCVYVGMCTGLIWQFLFWLIEDLADAQGCNVKNWVKTLEGIVMVIQCLGGELPFFFLSGWIMKKIGHINTMSLVLLALGVRLILHSILVNPWWILPVEFLHGLTFGLCFACLASYASIIAPPGTEATMQGMVGAIFEGVGVSLGSFAAGLSYKSIGGSLTFRYFGIGSLVMFVLHVFVQCLLKLEDCETLYTLPADTLEKVQDEEQRELADVD